MTRQELNRQSAACRPCKDGYYCSYHAAWNSHVTAMEGQRLIQESMRRAARQADPIGTLTLEERLVASIAVAHYRREKEVA